MSVSRSTGKNGFGRSLPNCRCLQPSSLVRPGSEATRALRVGKNVVISVRSIALLSGEKRVRFAYNVSLIAKTNGAVPDLFPGKYVASGSVFG